MSLRINSTLEAFINRIIRNTQIMNILKLPVINENDDQDLIDEKRIVLIDKFITKTAQIPSNLDSEFPEVEIDNVIYSNYGKIRITVSLAQSIKTDSDIFGEPQVDINVYYDNTEIESEQIFELFDLLSDEFSGQNLEVKVKNNRSFLRNIRCEGQTSQTPMINNYERIGLRFSFFATLYKN